MAPQTSSFVSSLACRFAHHVWIRSELKKMRCHGLPLRLRRSTWLLSPDGYYQRTVQPNLNSHVESPSSPDLEVSSNEALKLSVIPTSAWARVMPQSNSVVDDARKKIATLHVPGMPQQLLRGPPIRIASK